MSTFENVSLTKAANVYFDGGVTSRSLTLENGDKVSLGIMVPGDYKFGTEEKEIMEILAGELQVLLPGSSEWLNIKGGESFKVPANSAFEVKVQSLTDYCCYYIT